MPNCPKCEKPVYFAERKSSLGKDWHSSCLRCERCNKTLTPGGHAEHKGKPFCHRPCYATLFGPSGYGRGGVAESFVYDTNGAVVGESTAAPPLPTQPQPTPQATN